jgi:hypothetical protein
MLENLIKEQLAYPLISIELDWSADGVDRNISRHQSYAYLAFRGSVWQSTSWPYSGHWHIHLDVVLP